MTEPLWIEEQDALALHDRLLALWGGAAGVRDPALLKSALPRPQPIDAYADASDWIDLAAAYTAGIVRNHGNRFMNYELISFVLCPFVQRSVIALKEKQVPFEITYIDLSDPPAWFLAISPMGKVPVLRVDGQRVLFESAVINEYLDEVHPPPLHPQDPWLRAYNRAWIEFGSNLIGRQYRMLVASDAEGYIRERDGLLADLRHLENQLGDGPFFNGAAFSLIDTVYAPLFMRLDIIERHHAQGLLTPTPKVGTWREALLARPSVRESVVNDFEARFRQRFAQQGGWLGQRLT